MEDEKYDSAKLFGHIRVSKYNLKSTINVGNLLVDNKDVFAVAVLFESMKELFFHRYNGKCYHSLELSDIFDQRRIAYYFCANVDDRLKELDGQHHGDCTRASGSCCICSSESIYSLGLELFDEWKSITIEENIICTDLCVKLLSILISCETLWVKHDHLFSLCSRKYENTPGSTSNFDQVSKERNELWEGLWEIQFCYNHWKSLSLQEKELCHKRAVRFRAYFDNRPVVEGIPWW